ncbi:hypothetical protein F5Y06DRAFT_274525 [Hypoxylon sp. FL0890]|nr:hypothetical protein F5Y06DRAFT_274525 [Hypoxylon sp. FL0890]
MDSLPHHIYYEIITLLDGPAVQRPVLATISRRWQMAIERQTFRHISLESSDLDHFKKIVRHDRRRYSRQIEYKIVLPAYSDGDRGRFERENDRRANNEAFTAAIHDLFHILKSWDVDRDGSIELSIRDAYSTADHEFLRQSHSNFGGHGKVNLAGFKRPDDGSPHGLDLWSWRYAYSYLDLLQSSALPTVPVIWSFRVRPMTRRISPCALFDIMAKLPGLFKVHLMIKDYEVRYAAFRRSLRYQLAQTILNVLPTLSAVEELELHMFDLAFWCSAWGATNLIQDDATSDPLCNAIRAATGQSRTLKRLKVWGVMDGSLLWPGPDRTLSEPYWQSLEHIAIRFSMRRPSGGCYFRVLNPVRNDTEYIPEYIAPLPTELPPGHGHSEEEDAEAARRFSLPHHFGCDDIRSSNVVPDDDSLVPLIEAFGRACLQMRSLESAELTTRIPVSFETDTGETLWSQSLWGVWYVSPGARSVRESGLSFWGPDHLSPAFFENPEQGRLLWAVKDWRPSIELSSLLRDIGRDRYGTQLVEKFLDCCNTIWKEATLEHWRKRHNGTW